MHKEEQEKGRKLWTIGRAEAAAFRQHRLDQPHIIQSSQSYPATRLQFARLGRILGGSMSQSLNRSHRVGSFDRIYTL